MVLFPTGYPTHFGQLECMKLTASPHFPEKRIGYLGMMLLLSEEADVLMLATNALKNDLNSDNKFVAGLALCAIGNLATADMSRDLVPEVDKHLKSPLAYIRKKAALAMARCLSKCPDMVEDFVDRLTTLLKDKSHGVLITVVQLMTQVLTIDFVNAQEEGEDPWSTPCREAFTKLVPTLVKMLRNLLTAGYSPDHDVNGISDPFLQVQLLTVLRLLGCNNVEASEQMNDVLAQVATNTETSKNAGNAILYECVLTIMGIESEDGLRVLAVNILGRFLLNRDNNIRYVALNTLSKCIEDQAAATGNGSNSAMSALQRHRTTVVDCLKDPDVSIRQRALELIYHLVNESNVQSLVAELLNYLVLCPREHKSDICSRVLKVVDRFSPDDRWRVDTLITTLTIAGREAEDRVQSATIVYISQGSDEIHAFAVHKLLKAVRDDDGTQHGLLAVGLWCIGEYGDLLLRPYTYTPTAVDGDLGGMSTEGPITMMASEPDAIISTVEAVANRPTCPEFVKHRALTAYAKLTVRLVQNGDTSALGRLQQLLKKDEVSRSLELQLRSCEYSTLVDASRGIARKAQPVGGDLFGVTVDESSGVSQSTVSAAMEALQRMPVFDAKILQKRLAADQFGHGADRPVQERVSTGQKQGGDLLDLNDLFGAAPAPTVSQPVATATEVKSDLDLLSDIFSAGPVEPVASAPSQMTPDLFGITPAAVQAPTPPQPQAVNPLDLFDSTPVPTSAAPSQPIGELDIFGAPAAPQQSSTEVCPGFSHAGLTVEFQCSKPDSMNQQVSVLVAQFKNDSGSAVHGLNLQVAVPKYVSMELEPPSATTVPPGPGSVTQKISVTNSMLGSKALMLKVKISFTVNGQRTEKMATCSSFPSGKY